MTPLSFLLQVGDTEIMPDPACRKLFPYQDIWTAFEIPCGRLIINGSHTEPSRTSTADVELFVFGPSPETRLSGILKALDVDELPELQEAASGHVVIAVKEGRLWIVRGEPGSIPVFYAAHQSGMIVSTELKPMCCPSLPEHLRAKLSRPEYFALQPYYKPASQSPLEGISRLEAGAVLSVNLKTLVHKLYPSLPRRSYVHRNVASASKRLHDLLTNRIRTSNTPSERIGIPLSGGYDSGCVASIVSAHAGKVKSITIGTESVNEFDDAREMAAFIDSDHREYVIPDEALLPAIVHGIWLNELSDPVYAEGYSGLYFAFREASDQCDVLWTGYGADLTLGNFRQVAEDRIAEESVCLVKRAGQTGELSPYVAAHFGLHIHQPFLSKEIVEFIISMPPNFKIRNGISKYIEREMIRNLGLMPDALLNRPKRALHTGAGIDRMFVKLLGVKEDPGYRLRSAFLFQVWKELIFDHKEPDMADIDHIVGLARRQAGI